MGKGNVVADGVGFDDVELAAVSEMNGAAAAAALEAGVAGVAGEGTDGVVLGGDMSMSDVGVGGLGWADCGGQ